MKQSSVNTFLDPDDWNDDEITITYPCNTKNMTYNALERKYYLTPEALEEYGVDVERKYVAKTNNKVKELIENTTKRVYQFINFMSGNLNYGIMLWRIATSKVLNMGETQYAVRKNFEKLLIEQAIYRCEYGDSTNAGRYDITGDNNGQTSLTKDIISNFNDLSPIVMTELVARGLAGYQKIIPNRIISNDEY